MNRVIEESQQTFWKECPRCGSLEVEVNTWEAWCYSCDWWMEKSANPELFALFREARLNEIRHLQPILEREMAELDRVMNERNDA